MEELSLKEILKMLIPKMKMILVVLLIAAVAGGFIGIARTYDSTFYGTSISFYVNPKNKADSDDDANHFGVYGAYGWHVMDNMTKLLGSESFAEKMILDENELPLKSVLDKTKGDRTEIDAKIAEAEALMAEAEAALAAAEEAAPEDKADKLAEWQQKQRLADEKREESLELYRKTDVYAENITLLTKSVRYAFYTENDTQVSNNTDALAKSFVYVTIKVSESEEAAKFVYGRINEVLPSFVEENMVVPQGFAGTNCQRITRLDEIKPINSGSMFSSGIKYAVLFGALAFVVSVVGVIVIDRAKKWYKENKASLLGAPEVELGDGMAEGEKQEADQSDAVEWK